ncbi:MAG: hypothetical protein KGM98_04055 [Bacteroidota bacterium]|nr:hypothetical protein [Bacteroidota bacterium]
MKIASFILLCILFSFIACLFLPWWSIAIVAFLVSLLIPQKPWKSFLSGFLALFLLWGGLSLWISSNNNHILAHRVSLLLFKADSPMLLIAITALVGGLVAGFASLAGSFTRK